jgi:hypothetical protein
MCAKTAGGMPCALQEEYQVSATLHAYGALPGKDGQRNKSTSAKPKANFLA